MKNNVIPGAYDDLQTRGYIKQATNSEKLRAALEVSPQTFYAGFDPTADSLHVGSLLPIMAMARLQQHGHQPIAIVGGGTALIGDPSGKNEMRQMLTPEQVRHNMAGIRTQLARFMNLDGEAGLLLNNGDWILDLNYIRFLRSFGRYFRVNEMIRNESYRQRLAREEGLSFLEFNYQLLQGYDFHYLAEHHDCSLQIGGDDQWGNILAGTELVRRDLGRLVHGLTLPLLTTAAGTKMGKTANGAIWLDPDRTSPFAYYQYWLNVDDRDVIRFLKLFTFVDKAEIEELACLQGAAVRVAKRRLAEEATALCHGRDEANKAAKAAKALFVDGALNTAHAPRSLITATELDAGIPVGSLFARTGLAHSKSEAMRVIRMGGAYLNGERISDPDLLITSGMQVDRMIQLRRGKKSVHVIEITT